MWLFTKHGFFSAVQNWDDASLIHVRARFQGDLEKLCEAYGVEPKVVSLPDADYPYRMDSDREKLAEIAKNDAYLEKRFSRKLTDVAAKQESLLIKLKSDYEQNRDRWVDEIVDRVVG